MKVKQLGTRKVLKHAEEIFHGIRWRDGIIWCPYCGCLEVKDYGGYHYRCKHCHNRFTDRTRTIMHNSKLPTDVWMQAVYEIISTNFISGYELADKLEVTQKTAWYMHFKISHAMNLENIRMTGVISMDEVYLGCHMRNMHLRRKLGLLEDRKLIRHGERYTKEAIYTLNSEIKQHVYGLTNGDKVVLHVCPNPIKSEYLHTLHKMYCESGCITVSDDSALYRGWEDVIGPIKKNCHSKHQYVTEDGYSSNPIENMFSWLERGYAARMTHSKYTQIYLQEYCFRKNTRNMTTEEKFRMVLEGTIGNYITYKDIKEYNPWIWLPRDIQAEKDAREMAVMKELFEHGLIESAEYKHRTYHREDFLE